MNYDIGFIMDGLILVFLGVTIFYAARLTLFLKYFREGREGMQILIRDLNRTISKAENSIATMKENARITESEMAEIVNEAKFLSDELRFMNESGDGLADRLEKLAARNRELIDLMENAGGIGTQKIEPFEPSKPKHKQQISHRQIHTDSASVQSRMQAVREELQREDTASFEIDDFDFDAEMEADDEMDFMALEDGAYREEDIPDEIHNDFPSQFKKPLPSHNTQGQSHHSKINTDSKSKLRSFAIFDRDFLDSAEEEPEEDLQEESQFHSRAEKDLYEALQRRKKKSNGRRISEQA
jgi:hypothetical protein